MSEAVRSVLQKRLEGLEQVPSLPIVVAPLLRYLEQPLDSLDIQRVIGFVSQDKSLAAQCLHMANSPLFGRWQAVDSIRSAVIALGIQRMRDITISCSLLKLTPSQNNALDPTVFWEHSLGCALVCRRFATKISFVDPGKAYLAGLLHDLGLLVNLWILPKEFGEAVALAQSQHIPLHEAEQSQLGMDHCESGRLLAERWQLTPDLAQVIAHHHDPEHATDHVGLVALVSLSDLLCRMSALGHGYVEYREIDIFQEKAFALLLQSCPALPNLDWARLTFELEGYLDEVHRLVSLLYRPQ